MSHTKTFRSRLLSKSIIVFLRLCVWCSFLCSSGFYNICFLTWTTWYLIYYITGVAKHCRLHYRLNLYFLFFVYSGHVWYIYVQRRKRRRAGEHVSLNLNVKKKKVKKKVKKKEICKNLWAYNTSCSSSTLSLEGAGNKQVKRFTSSPSSN